MRLEQRPERTELREPLQRLPDVSQARWNVREKGRVPLHPIDVDEAAGVLELALHGDQIELAPDHGGVALDAPREGSDAVVDQLGWQHHVRVAQQGDQIVDLWTDQGILEVDQPEALAVAGA